MSKIQILSQILAAAQHARTLTAVANHLFVSQPYVTQVLQAAERQYHVTLIKRDTLPIQLTAAGSSLLKQLERLIADENTLNSAMAVFANKHQGPVTITFNPPLATLMGPELFTQLEQAFPDVFFEFKEATYYLASQALQENKTQLYVGSVAADPSLQSWLITHDERPCLLIPNTSPVYAKVSSRLDFSALLPRLAGADYVGLAGPSFFQDTIDRIFREQNVPLHLKLRVPNVIAATLTALHSSAITATLPFILPRLQLPVAEYRLIPIPSTAYDPRLGISTRKDAGALIQHIATTLQGLVGQFYSGKLH